MGQRRYKKSPAPQVISSNFTLQLRLALSLRLPRGHDLGPEFTTSTYIHVYLKRYAFFFLHFLSLFLSLFFSTFHSVFPYLSPFFSYETSAYFMMLFANACLAFLALKPMNELFFTKWGNYMM